MKVCWNRDEVEKEFADQLDGMTPVNMPTDFPCVVGCDLALDTDEAVFTHISVDSMLNARMVGYIRARTEGDPVASVVSDRHPKIAYLANDIVECDMRPAGDQVFAGSNNGGNLARGINAKDKKVIIVCDDKTFISSSFFLAMFRSLLAVDTIHLRGASQTCQSEFERAIWRWISIHKSAPTLLIDDAVFVTE